MIDKARLLAIAKQAAGAACINVDRVSLEYDPWLEIDGEASKAQKDIIRKIVVCEAQTLGGVYLEGYRYGS